jgi:peroxiredoxin Q/BCP
MAIAVGDKAPGFSAPDQDGKMHQLSDYSGRWLLLYFYPKDDTAGCTKEACGIRDSWDRFKELNAAVLGVSTDDVKSHRKFADKYQLDFPLLADADKKVVEDYGVWGEKKFMGRTYMGTNRTSFLIGPDGRIVTIYEKVKPETHAAETLLDIFKLSSK